jgi:hypothetical protein
VFLRLIACLPLCRLAFALAVAGIIVPSWDGPVSGDDTIPAALFLKDALTVPNQPAVIQAGLETGGPGKEVPVAGELLELVYEGKVLETATTDSAGRAAFHFTPKVRGCATVSVRTREGSRVRAGAAATVASWERRTPILAVELAALVNGPGEEEPLADAADELGKLAQFYYNLLYVVSARNNDPTLFRTSQRTRDWLTTHGFPAGYVLVLREGIQELGTQLDALREDGWTTLKMGIGRSRQFAEAFVQRRLEVVMVPEPAKPDRPRKAKIAKDWKEVRKKL